METTDTSRRISTRNWMIALLAAFLLGLIPMWIMAHKRSSEADNAKRELRTAH